MNYTEAVTLVALVKSACSAQKFEEMTATVWQGILEDVSYGDAAAAVKVLGRRLRFIAPSDIIEESKKMRADRSRHALSSFPDSEYFPKYIDGEDDSDYARRSNRALKAYVKFLADGGADPEAKELPQRFEPQALTRGVFKDVPRVAPSTRLPSQRVEASPRMKALMRARLERSA